MVIEDRATNFACLIQQGAGAGDASQGLEVTLISAKRDFGSSIEIGNAAPEFAPLLLAMSIAFFRAVDFELFGMKDGGLDPQDATLFIIDLKGVTAEVMTQSYAFWLCLRLVVTWPLKAGWIFRLCRAWRLPRKRKTSGLWKLLRA